MTQPWHGTRPPDEPVTIVLPYRTAKRVLVSVVNDAKRANSRGDDPVGVELLAGASDVIGDAIEAPPHRRFRIPEKLYHAVIVGTEDEYDRVVAVTTREFTNDELVMINDVDQARSMVYSGYTTAGTWYRRDDAQELVAAVKIRTFAPYEVRGRR